MYFQSHGYPGVASSLYMALELCYRFSQLKTHTEKITNFKTNNLVKKLKTRRILPKNFLLMKNINVIQHFEVQNEEHNVQIFHSY